MKKLLSILTISTLTASIPAPLLANTLLTRTKRDVSPLTSNSNNDYLPLKKIDEITGQINSIAVDSKNNIYFGTDKGAFVLKYGATTPTNIDLGERFIYIHSLAVDSNDNIYIAAYSEMVGGIYKINKNETTATKINDIDNVVSLAVDSKDNVYIAKQTTYGKNQLLKLMSGVISLILNLNENNGNVWNVSIDSKDNVYFGTSEGAYKLVAGSDTKTKINDIDNVVSLAVDSKDNIYFGTNKGIYKLIVESDIATKINGINGYVNSLAVDNKNNVYFSIFSDSGAVVLKHGETKPTPINDFDESIKSLVVDKYNNNIYLKKDNGIYFTTTVLDWVKQQSQFALVDSTKTQTWTRPDLLSVDGELNIDIANPNIDKVVFDNVQQGQTNKHWTINVKPETAPHDHNLQVMFTLDGKPQYTSEITVSMQAKIDPPAPSVNQNLGDLIKTTDLGNIIDNNDNTIFSAVNQKNSNVDDDFSQIKITDKTTTQATLSAIEGSKSYAGSVDVKYNVVPATTVDLKIDLTPTSSTATVIKDYLGQIDISNITNPVDTFYYANSESVITMVKPTASSVIAGVVYGCDDKWNKTSQPSNINPSTGIKLDGSQLNTKEGKYVIELSDNLGHTNNVYLQINKEKKDIKEYWNTDNSKQFEIWAKANGYDNIRGSSASQLKKLFAESKNWQQLASDSQLASAVADWFKINGKLSATEPLTKEQVIEQLKTQIPSSFKIPAVNTSNYDVNKVSFELNKSEFKPNDKVNIVVKYNNASEEKFNLQIKNSNTPDNNKKDGDSKLWIIGIVVGVLASLGLAYWLFKRFVFDKYFLPKIKKRRHDKLVEQVRKEEAEKEAAKQ